MVRILFLIITCLILGINSSFALDIVYPTKNDLTINAQSVFFIGNVHPKSTLKINNENVKIWEKGGFVHVIPLSYGKNQIKLEETIHGKRNTLIYNIRRNKPSSIQADLIPYVPKNKDEILYTKTINNNSTVRNTPSSSGKRIVELPKDVVLYVLGKKGDYYKIDAESSGEFWIHKSNIQPPEVVSKKFIAKVKNPETYSDKYYNYTSLRISHPVLYTIEQQDKKLILTLYGAKKAGKNTNQDSNAEFIFEDENQVLGYDIFIDEDKLILRRAKIADKINPNTPLYNVRIFVDAGHGGIEKGSVGPTRVCEKDINLAISKKLIKMLKDDGAIVSYSRLEDKQVKLYDRVKIAKENNAFISLSIHSNALPDGKDPYIDHGTETHYYNENAKVLAYIIKNNLVQDLNLKDNGLRKSSFALNRSTNPISVLVEVAYMINPEEYQRLQNDKFQTEVAKSLKKSLGEFMILLKK